MNNHPRHAGMQIANSEGGVHVLVNAAGIMPIGPIELMSEDWHHRAFEVRVSVSLSRKAAKLGGSLSVGQFGSATAWTQSQESDLDCTTFPTSCCLHLAAGQLFWHGAVQQDGAAVHARGRGGDRAAAAAPRQHQQHRRPDRPALRRCAAVMRRKVLGEMRSRLGVGTAGIQQMSLWLPCRWLL